MGEPKFDLTNGLSTGEAQVLSAVALLLVTATAAMFAFRAVRETRKARKQAVRPVLALDLNFISPVGYARIVVANVGQGAAVDADLELSFRPATETGAAPIVRSWTWPLLAPGQTYEFNPPDMDDKFPTVSDLALVWPMVALKGNVRDQLGKVHPGEPCGARPPPDLEEGRERGPSLGDRPNGGGAQEDLTSARRHRVGGQEARGAVGAQGLKARFTAT